MSHHLLDETSAKAFRAAKLRYAIIIGSLIALAITCTGLVIYNQNQKNKFAKIAKEYAEINSLYYQENLQELNTSQNSESVSEQNVDHTKSMSLFAQFAVKHATEPYGWQAAIRTGNYYINQGNLQVAKELFEAIIPYTTKAPILQIKLGTVLSGIYTQENDTEKALQQIESTNKIAGNPLPEQTKLFQAKILYIFGKTDESRQISNTLNTAPAKIWLNYTSYTDLKI